MAIEMAPGATSGATIDGGDGNDMVIGSDLADTIRGGAGDDDLFGGDGDDRIFGDGGHDWLVGEDGNDTLDGGDGNDRLTGMAGADTYRGGPGADTADYWDQGRQEEAQQGRQRTRQGDGPGRVRHHADQVEDCALPQELRWGRGRGSRRRR